MCVYRTQLSYAKSVQAVKGVLEILKDKLPDSCGATMDGLLSAVHSSQVVGTVNVMGTGQYVRAEFRNVTKD